jgi:filamentous hemagglutinin family protein
MRKLTDRKSTLLAGCALASAMAAAPFTESAQAQALQGNPTVVSGGATFNRSLPNIDTINVSAPQTVINWTTFDNATGGAPITFLNSSGTALYQNDSGITDFTVLNRILPTDSTRAIRFDGTVQSRINGQAGGSVWFYSPGGLILGSTALFDVGNLVLTANDIDTTGGLFGAPGSSIRFRGASGSTSGVTLESGARILAQVPGSYVALVAPIIKQAGTVTVDGSAAYIAGEQVDVRISGGLFDIEFLQGTAASGTVIEHSGVTTGPAPSSSGEQQRIYLAAYPKNDAVTMLVTSGLGFAAASDAFVDNGQVVLSAGRAVRDIGVSGGLGLGPSSVAASITIDGTSNLNFTSGVAASATGDVIISPRAGLTLDFDHSLSVLAGGRAEVGAGAGESIIVGGNLSIATTNKAADAEAYLYALNAAGSGLSNGQVIVGGSIELDGGSTIGTRTPTARIVADRGSISSGNSIFMDVTDDNRDERPTVSGAATVDVLNGGSLTAVGGIFVDAFANASGNSGFTGGDATGGTIRLTVKNSVLNAGSVQLSSGALAQSGSTATAGTSIYEIENSTLTLDSLTLNADAGIGGGNIETVGVPGDFGSFGGGLGGGGSNAGTGNGAIIGGDATFSVVDSVVNLSGTLTLSASADGSTFGGRPAPDVTGGNASLIVKGGSLTANALDISAKASAPLSVNDAATPSTTTGGTITITPDGAAVTINNLTTLDATAIAPGGSTLGGDAVGGNITIAPINNGLFQSFSLLTATASAFGGQGTRGGNATGGTILLAAVGGDIRLNSDATLNAAGSGGSANANDFDGNVTGIASGNGNGGTITINVGAAGGPARAFRFSSLEANAGGTIGISQSESFQIAGGAGGVATGGAVAINVANGTLTGGTANLVARAEGGGGGDAHSTDPVNGGAGGNAVAGTVRIAITGGDVDFINLTLDAGATGGAGGIGRELGAAGAGGNATGGVADISITGGSLSSAFVSQITSATGGNGGDALSGGNGAAGGNGFSGITRFAVGANGLFDVFDVNSGSPSLQILLRAAGFGGRGGSGAGPGNSGAGGIGRGGTVMMSLAGPFATSGSSETGLAAQPRWTCCAVCFR